MTRTLLCFFSVRDSKPCVEANSRCLAWQGRCTDFRDACDALSKVGFRMFLGVTATATNWAPDGTACTLVLSDNPLADYVEVPEQYRRVAHPACLIGVNVSSHRSCALMQWPELLQLVVWSGARGHGMRKLESDMHLGKRSPAVRSCFGTRVQCRRERRRGGHRWGGDTSSWGDGWPMGDAHHAARAHRRALSLR